MMVHKTMQILITPTKPFCGRCEELTAGGYFQIFCITPTKPFCGRCESVNRIRLIQRIWNITPTKPFCGRCEQRLVYLIHTL